MKENIQIYVVSHSLEDIRTIKQDDLYTPLFVGRKGKENFGFLSDDTGDNISEKNPYYSELTALYWMCKNSPYEIIGLVHYRRYFAKSQFGRLLNKEDVEEILKNHDLIVPERTERLEGSVENSFKDPLAITLLESSEKFIKENCPEYESGFLKVMKSSKISFFNMFIGPKELMNDYCDWLFPILNYSLENIDISSNPRILGFISEILFNVWIEENNLKIYECPLKYKGFKLRIRMFLLNSNLLRWGYKHFIIRFLEK